MQLQRNYQSSKHDSFVNYYHADGCMLAVSTISCNENNVFATPRISRSRLETRRRWIVVTRQWNVTAVSKLEIVPINRVHLGFIERESFVCSINYLSRCSFDPRISISQLGANFRGSDSNRAMESTPRRGRDERNGRTSDKRVFIL